MSKSENLYSAARELIPGGVNSPVRAFTGVGGTPLFIEKADGAYLYDAVSYTHLDVYKRQTISCAILVSRCQPAISPPLCTA